MKSHADKRWRAKPHRITSGMKVICKSDPKPLWNKWASHFNDSAYTVDSVNGSMVTATSADGHTVTRNSSFFKQITQTGFNERHSRTPSDSLTQLQLWPVASPGGNIRDAPPRSPPRQQPQAAVPIQAAQRRYPQRTSVPPVRFTPG